MIESDGTFSKPFWGPAFSFMRAASTKPAPTDGPTGAYVPRAVVEWAALGITAPTHLYLCQDASGSLVDDMGDQDATATGTVHVYQQTITGWTRKFVGFSAEEANARWSRAARVIGASESVAMLIYAAFESSVTTRAFGGCASHGLSVNTGPGIDISGNTNTPRVASNGVVGTGANSHAGLTTVRPYFIIRDAVNDVTKLFTNLEEISTTHFEGATASSIGYIGATGGTTRISRYGFWALWEPSECAALIAAGKGNKTLLTALGWSLPY